MKIRSGFVSNSSSSSFLVVFPKVPKTVEEVKMILFGKLEGCVSLWDDSVSYDRIAETVLKDIQSQKANVFKTITDEFEGSGAYYFSEYNNFQEDEYIKSKYFGGDKISLKKLKETALKYKEITDNRDKLKKKLTDVIEKPYLNYKKETDKIYKKYINIYGINHKKYHLYDIYLKRSKKIDNIIQKKLNENESFVKLEMEYRKFSQNYWKTENKLQRKCAKKDALKFLETFKDKFIFRFNYSDNDGAFFSLMEHGDIFEKLENIRFSHH